MLLKRSPLVVAMLASGFAGPLAAAEPEVVVVVGETTDRILDSAAIERAQALDLEDLFRFEPAVTVGGGMGIAQKIYVRDVEDTYLHVTVDGAPQTSTLFHHVGRVSIEPELLEQVEVQAGAGEATAGPGALGGAIRFKTKDAEDLLRPGAQVGARVKAGYFSNGESYKTSVTGYARITDAVNVLISGVFADFGDFENGNGRTVQATGTEQTVGFVKLGGDSGSHDYSLSHEWRKEDGELGRRPNWETEGGDRFPTAGERGTSIANYGFSPQQGALTNAAITVYRTAAELQQDTGPDNWGVYGGEVESYGFDARSRWQLGAHDFTVGVDHREDEVTSAYLSPREIWDGGDPSMPGSFVEDGKITGVYAQNHWRVAEPVLLSFGARYDDYEFVGSGAELGDSKVSFNAGVNWSLSPSLTASLGYAEAFRGKLVSDAFTLEGAAVDPQLQPEEADNVEVALRYSEGGFIASATVYHAHINNVIHDQQGRGTYFENIGELATHGYELRATYQADAHYFSATYHQSDAELDQVPIRAGFAPPDGVPAPADGSDYYPPIDNVPVTAHEYQGVGTTIGDTLSLTYEWQPSEVWILTAGWRFTDRVDDISVLERSAALGWTDPGQTLDKRGYVVTDVAVEWRPLEFFSAVLSVQNLFDKAYRHHASVEDYTDFPPAGDWDGLVGPLEPGRDIRLTLSAEF